MGVAEQSSLIVTIRLNDQMSPTAVRVGKSVADLERKTLSLRRATDRLGQGLRTGVANSAKIAAVGVGLLAYNIRQGINELVEWEDAQLQINAVLKSTNQVAGVTAAQTEKLALKYAELTNYEDDVILGAEAILLRFPNIRKKAFEPTLKAATDLAAGMGRDLPTAARSLALAMNNPTVGLARLTRQGIAFSDQQKEQIKRLVESGKLQKAQGIILAQVSKVYGGSAQKATEGYRGSMTRLNKAVKDLQQNLAAPLIGPLSKLARRLADFAKSPEIKQGLTDLGNAIAGLFSNQNLDAGFRAIKDGFTFLEELDWSTIRSGFDVSASILKQAISLFTSLPAPIQGALVSFLAINKLTGGLGTAAVKGLAELMVTGLKTITAVNVTVVGTNVVAPGAGGGGAVPTGGFDLRTLLVQMGARAWPIIGMALEMDDRAREIGRQVELGQTRTREGIFDRSFRSGFATGRRQESAGTAIGAFLRQFIKVTPYPGFTAPPGARGAVTPSKVEFTREASRALREGTVQAKDFQRLYDSLKAGDITYKQAVRALHIVERNTRATTQAVKNARYEFTLKPSVTISAAATQNAIVFAANGQRLIIS